MSPKKTGYENPLIPNARLKQMYRAILRAHLLGQALPPEQRALTAGREAALVSTYLDLTARDLVSDSFNTPVLDLLHDGKLRSSFWTAKQVQNPRISPSPDRPRRLASPTDAATRIYSALGAAAALKASAASADRESKSTASDSAVVLSILTSGEVPEAIWKAALSFAAEHDLPVIFVVLPFPPQKASRPAKTTDLRALAHRAHVPAMPVDAADPVALYRVAQESIGHARIGGGPALIHCIASPTNPARHSATSNLALAHLEDYILSRNIATRAWMDREAESFSAQVRSVKFASK